MARQLAAEEYVQDTCDKAEKEVDFARRETIPAGDYKSDIDKTPKQGMKLEPKPIVVENKGKSIESNYEDD